MLITLLSVILLAFSPNFGVLLIAAALMGIGSAIFHPEASRVARMASGGKFGTAQSLFQVGGNSGFGVRSALSCIIYCAVRAKCGDLGCCICIIGIMMGFI